MQILRPTMKYKVAFRFVLWSVWSAWALQKVAAEFDSCPLVSGVKSGNSGQQYNGIILLLHFSNKSKSTVPKLLYFSQYLAKSGFGEIRKSISDKYNCEINN